MNKHTLSATASYVIWGFLTIYWKQLSSVDSIYTLCSRIVWAAITIFFILLFNHKFDKVKEVMRDKKMFTRLAFAGVFISLNWGGFIWCVANDHILDASLAYFMSPLLSIIVGGVIFKEKLGKVRWLAVATAAFGIAYQMIAGGAFPYVSILLALTFAAYSTVKKGLQLDSDVSIFIETIVVMPIALFVIIYMELNGTGAFATNALVGWRYIFLPLAGIVTFIPLALYSFGIKEMPLSLAGILMFINPTLQFLVGAVLYGEPLTQPQAVTFFFVWLAIAIFLGKDAYDRKQVSKINE